MSETWQIIFSNVIRVEIKRYHVSVNLNDNVIYVVVNSNTHKYVYLW